MTSSIRKHLGIRNALSVILTLASHFVYVAAATAGQQSLEVIDLSSTSAANEVSEARAAFAKGGAIIVMTDTSPDELNRTFGSYIPSSKAFTSASNTPIKADSTVSKSEPLTLRGVAAYVDASGIAHSVQALAPANDSDPARQGWRKHLDDWIQAEQTKALTGVGDPTPPEKAWTLLEETTIEANSHNQNFEQNTIEIYRLNAITTAADYYMVFTEPEVKPAWQGNCNGFDQCDWHTISRSFTHAASPSTGLIDHGPTGTVGDGTVSFSIGADLNGDGPGGGVEFSADWSQPAVSTVDNSSSTDASWNETFEMKSPISPCNPPGGAGSVPGTSSGTFTSEQGSIFEVPEGTTSISFTITAVANWCDYNTYAPNLGVNNDSLNLAVTLSLGPPVLQAAPTSLTIPAGGTAPLLVGAYIPNSEQGLPWQITSNQLWLTVPSQGPFTTGQVVPVTVAQGIADGTGGTLSINTSPPFAAPSVTKGPILVNVTVGTPKASHIAGILLFGGLGVGATSAEFYDLASQTVVPVTPSVTRQYDHTATLLNTGNILIAGGMTEISPSREVTAAAELYQPASFSFAPTRSLATARAGHTATLLPDGKVLIVGGVDANGSSLSSAELYDPATGTFSSAGNLQTPRSYHSASLMRATPTQVVVYGGYTTDVSAPDDGWELWDEASNAFIKSGTMAAPAAGIPQPLPNAPPPYSPTNLDLVGGQSYGNQITAQEQILNTFNTASPSFELESSYFNLQVPRAFHTLTSLPNGAVLLVTGGTTTDRTKLASAETSELGAWTLLSGTATCPGSPGCMLAARANHTATLLPDGRVLLVGGNDSGPNTEFYDPASKTFTPGPAIQRREGHTATLVVTTVTSLIATPPSSTFGQTVNLAASVTSAVGTPTGSVHFLDGSKELGSAQLVKGQASINVATLSIGSHALKAVYAGDGVSSGSESAVVTQAVSGSTSSTSLSLSPNPSQFGSAVTMTASVSGTGGPATGTVVFSDGGKQIASADLASGSASAQVTNLGIGQHPITATYKGNGDWEGSTSDTITQTVTAVKVSTTTSLSSNNNPSTSGQSVTFQATVNPASRTGVPAGTVNFLDGSTFLGSADLVSGTARFTTSSLAEGQHSIVGTYLGDSNFSASTSSVLTQTVSSSGGGKVTPTVDLTVNGSTSSTVSAGETVTFVARIHAAPGYPWPTGSISISDSTNANSRYGSANIVKDPNSNDGLATITNAGIPAGSYMLVATYGGDNQGKYYNGAPSNTVSLTVKP
ncbi:MAG: Ig-like domain repeat protein [Bryobacteraceae bacterium]